jgi:hypothetical protein
MTEKAAHADPKPERGGGAIVAVRPLGRAQAIAYPLKLCQEHCLTRRAGIEMDQKVPRQPVDPHALHPRHLAQPVFDRVSLGDDPARQAEA